MESHTTPLLIPRRKVMGDYRNGLRLSIYLSVCPSICLSFSKLSCPLHISWTLWKIFIKLWSNVRRRESMCRTNKSTMPTQGQGQVKVMGLTLPYVLNCKAFNHQTLFSASSRCTDLARILTWWPWPIFCTPVTLTHFIYSARSLCQITSDRVVVTSPRTIYFYSLSTINMSSLGL